MNIPTNIELQLVVEFGELKIKVMDKGQYPWYDRTEIISAGIDLAELASALAAAQGGKSDG